MKREAKGFESSHSESEAAVGPVHRIISIMNSSIHTRALGLLAFTKLDARRSIPQRDPWVIVPSSSIITHRYRASARATGSCAKPGFIEYILSLLP